LPDPSAVAAVVVAYNGGSYLEACVRSLLAQTIDVEVIVVDNASTDGSIERLESAFGPRLRVIRRPVNGGYAAGANTGWRAISAPLVVILNQDVTLAPDCLARMREVLVAEPRDSLVTPKLVMASDPSHVNAVGNDVHLSGVAWAHGFGTATDEWRGVLEVTAISGAAFMARTSFLERLGGLDESYFMYVEDVDLSLRARLAGAVCLASCDAVATHDWSLHLTAEKFGLLQRNWRWLRRRFIGPAGAMWPVILQSSVIAWLYAALHGPAYLRAMWRAPRQPVPADSKGFSADLLRRLARHHPWHVLYPRSRLVQAIGAAVDDFVWGSTMALSTRRSRRDRDMVMSPSEARAGGRRPSGRPGRRSRP
jgi:GT2 family glycosyltransferase